MADAHQGRGADGRQLDPIDSQKQPILRRITNSFKKAMQHLGCGLFGRKEKKPSQFEVYQKFIKSLAATENASLPPPRTPPQKTRILKVATDPPPKSRPKSLSVNTTSVIQQQSQRPLKAVQPLTVINILKNGAPEQGKLPLEIRLMILEALLDDYALIAVAKLMGTCKMFYAMIREEKTIFKNRATLMGAPYMHNSWLQTYIAKARLLCVGCHAKYGDRRINWLPNEPKTARVCANCATSTDFTLLTFSTASAYGLQLDDLTNVIQVDGNFQTSGVLKALAEKKKRRFQQIESLVSTLDYKTQINFAVIRGRVEKGTASTNLEEAWQDLLDIKREMPDIESVQTFAQSRFQRQAKFDQITAELEKQDKLALLAKCEQALEWRLYSAEGPSWLSQLLEGKKTVEQFVARVEAPHGCHSPHKCTGGRGCSRTPAAACDKGMCYHCCTGCTRHTKRIRINRYVRYRTYWSSEDEETDSEYDY